MILLSVTSQPEQVRHLAGSAPQLAYMQRKPGLTWCAGRWGQTQRFRFCPRPAWVMPQLRTRCRCPIPLETLERTIGEAKTSRIMRGKFVSNNLLTKSKVPALVYLDQFVYLGLFENEKKYIVSCTFRCSTGIAEFRHDDDKWVIMLVIKVGLTHTQDCG